jgi:hypothetical protein
VLFRTAQAAPGVTILNRTEFTGFDQNEAGIWGQANDLDSGEAVEVALATGIGRVAWVSPQRELPQRQHSTPVVCYFWSANLRSFCGDCLS